MMFRVLGFGFLSIMFIGFWVLFLMSRVLGVVHNV